MDQIFGETLIKYQEPAAAPEEEAPKEEADPDAAPKEDKDKLLQNPFGNYRQEFQTQAVLGGDNLMYIGVLFSAEYCPPCQRLMEPLKNFYEEFSKDGQFELVMVNCDKREKEYVEHIKQMDWCYSVPFDVAPEVIIRLEDLAQASSIPKLAVFSKASGLDKFAVLDIKQIILKNESMAEAVAQVV